MGIITEKIEGKMIEVEIKSTNLKNAKYDTELKSLVVEFNNGGIYGYENVPWEVFTKFRMSESQGSFFSKNISKIYKYKKIK
jgi:lysyl-tRNA synthetase, class II